MNVIEESGRDNQGRCLWLCKCDCGNYKVVASRHLTQGKTKSCGCLQKELISKKMKTHGLTKNYKKLLGVWYTMLERCYNPHNKKYKNYGGSGVLVCEEWKQSVVAFQKWAIENGYDPNAKYGDCTIDRINPFGNYEPSNCRWVDMKTQANNRRIHFLK